MKPLAQSLQFVNLSFINVTLAFSLQPSLLPLGGTALRGSCFNEILACKIYAFFGYSRIHTGSFAVECHFPLIFLFQNIYCSKRSVLNLAPISKQHVSSLLCLNLLYLKVTMQHIGQGSTLGLLLLNAISPQFFLSKMFIAQEIVKFMYS